MGFERKKPTTVKLEFDGEYEGLVMNLRMPTIREYVEIIKMGNIVEDSIDETTFESMIDLIMNFAMSWNMEENGKPVPLTREELGSEEGPLLNLIFDGLGAAFSGVADRDLGKGSGSGETSLMSSLPQESL